MTALYYVTAPTPDGEFRIIIDKNNNVLASGFGKLDMLIKLLPTNMKPHKLEALKQHPYKQKILDYYSKDKYALNDIPVKLQGTDFQVKVWQALSKIPYGQTISYKQLATNAGNSRAIRAAASACGSNHIALIIPCHRVIKNDGKIGEYLYGTKIKQSLINHENKIK